jgi:acetyltransferase-like isoleucine patch superfamily enzyme
MPRASLKKITEFLGGQEAPLLFLAKTIYSRLYVSNCYIHAHAEVAGYKNIVVSGELKVGLRAPGFMPGAVKTFVRVRGRLEIEGQVSIGRGSRLDIGDQAVCVLNNCNLNGASDLIVRHKLTIGEGSTVSWGCQFLDDDWHTISYAGKKERDPEIVIGDRVWIGSRVLINKGVRIGDGSVVASGSVVNGVFPAAALIGGNPARIIREGVTWS